MSTIKRIRVLPTACPVEVAYVSRALAVAGPVITGVITTIINSATTQGRTGKNIVLVGRVAAAVNHVAIFCQRIFLTELHILAMQIVQV